jgi:hypothetical protein
MKYQHHAVCPDGWACQSTVSALESLPQIVCYHGCTAMPLQRPVCTQRQRQPPLLVRITAPFVLIGRPTTSCRRHPQPASLPSAERRLPRCVRVRGILDSYRKEHAAAEHDAEARGAETADAAAAAGGLLTFSEDDDSDDDTCPAECVTEVFTPQEFKRACQVRGSSHVCAAAAVDGAAAASMRELRHGAR